MSRNLYVRQFPQSVVSSAALGALTGVWQALRGRGEAEIRAVRTQQRLA